MYLPVSRIANVSYLKYCLNHKFKGENYKPIRKFEKLSCFCYYVFVGKRK